MTFDQTQIVTNGDMSQATINSNAVELSQLVPFTIQAVFTGAPVGTFKLQVSCDIVNIPANGSANMGANVVNWSDYTGSSQAISAAGNFAWIAQPGGFRWVRLVYTKTSGTGTLNATFNGQGV